jgi:carboxypeptidase C (cathepsin A)
LDSTNELTINQTEVAEDLYQTISGFIKKHPEYSKLDLYLAGIKIFNS